MGNKVANREIDRVRLRVCISTNKIIFVFHLVSRFIHNNNIWIIWKHIKMPRHFECLPILAAAIIVHWVVAMKRLKFVYFLYVKVCERYIEYIDAFLYYMNVRVLVKRSFAQNANHFLSLSLPLFVFSCACWISLSFCFVCFAFLFLCVYIYCLFAVFFFLSVVYKYCCYCCHGCFYFCSSVFCCCCSWWLFVCCCFCLPLPLHCLNLNKFICRSCKKGPLKNKSNKYLWKCLELQS